MVTPIEIEQLLALVDGSASGTPPETEWIVSCSDEEMGALLQHLPQRAPEGPAADGILADVLHGFCLRQRQLTTSFPIEACQQVARLYQKLGASSQARCYLLQLLAMARDRDSLGNFAELVVQDPPRDRDSVGLAFGPLFQSKDYDPRHLFPRLLAAVAHPSVASAIVDLANFVTREKLIATHPASERKQEFATLLGALVQRLAQLEEQPASDDTSLKAVARQVDDNVSLAVALCDALALIGDETLVGKLYQALDLRHRRLRTEAAAALARLDEQIGRETLINLAAEPVCRLRVLAFAEELGILDQIDPDYTTLEAQAESELALWLAQPSQLGIPPTRLELVDSRTQHWPGFDDLVECYLFRFVYEFAGGRYGNVGIAGPLAHAFAADLEDESLDDVYAAFAGWHAQHAEIFERDVVDLNDAQRVEVARLERRTHDAGFSNMETLQMGFFLGERALIGYAVREGHPGLVVTDSQSVQWHPTGNRKRPIGPHEAWSIYKGRKLMRSFN